MGAVEANMGTGFLVSQNSYGDFQLKAEVWIDPDANSGVFIRCADPQKIGADSCYEVNVYDKRPGQEYRTGGIVDHARDPAEGGRGRPLEHARDHGPGSEDDGDRQRNQDS